jgi:diaminohydroxyphosphoribosylaminopyrimidine deaminase/5-amino-6-(5-phosphoribosylamino)uracil reductase
VHELRQAYDVIVVGKNTVLKDNPSLTVRLENFTPKHPLRVVFIDLASIDFSLKLFSDEFKKNTLIATTDLDYANNLIIAEKLEKLGIGILSLKGNDDGRVNLGSFLKTMHSLKLNSILLEGGPSLASSFLSENLVDKISIITAPYLLGEGMTTLNNIGINLLEDKKEISNPIYKNLGKDFLVEGYLCLQD